MESAEKKLYFIYNPRAGKEKICGKLYGILQAMSDAGYEITVHPTRYRGDATERIKELDANEGYDLVVCSGGDGTLDEVVSGMMEREDKLPIGYIPAGSCNDFGRSLGLPSNMQSAAEIAVRGHNFAVDVGCFNGRTFVYVACFGIFTDVSYTTRQEIKNVLGHMAYILEGVKQLTAIKSYRMKIVDEERFIEGDFIFGMVTNSKSVGGFKNIIGKNVVFDDGVFECTFIRVPKTTAELQEILTDLSQLHIDSKYMYSFKSRRIEVIAEEPVPWALDGEFGGEQSIADISAVQRAVEIRVVHENLKNLTEKQQ